ncbi:MAG: dihydrolipoamide dehydrogenase [Muricauda sp.]|nr:DUF2911 domain-containing protein [Allomuricauda sp.]MAU25886.1 dihydrolipoamide dehydrogenase [Allomuricauda sp.]MBC30901.1 dihydrolipoamide dehydrogenase [Allomuricauda sp.]|tara:strand:- start:1035 stop:1886 length:852 start_codon:yes stop_codon:yes gene_type:complete
MKRLVLFAFVGLLSMTLSAQLIQTPQPSPSAKMEQTVGLTNVTVEYSRPSMKGRSIFGNLVPYDKLWRTGANKNTTVTFSDNVTIGGKELKAGSYAIFTKPGEAVWEVIFYSDTNNWGTPQKWDDSKVALMTKAQVQEMPMPIETFTITVDDLHNNGATLGMLWENVYVGVPFTVPTQEKTVKSIETVMSGPSANDYYAAASYYYDEGKDLEKAKEWIDKAVAMDKEGRAFWVMRKQSLIYAKLGDKQGAIEAAKRSLASAEAAKNADYVKLNKDSLKEWGAL